MTDQELVATLSTMRGLMISVATGGERIGEVESRFRELHYQAGVGLNERDIDASLPDDDLWAWHGHWSSGELPSWASRRAYVGQLFKPLLAAVRDARSGSSRALEPTGWQRVDRTIENARKALKAASTPENFQGIGLLCREALISIAEAVWQEDRHPTLDGTKPSSTDAKRRLEAFVAVELAGNVNEDARKLARSAFELANALQHKRAADWRSAALCLEAAVSVATLMAIIDGRGPRFEVEPKSNG